jgi:hypothetical protein
MQPDNKPDTARSSALRRVVGGAWPEMPLGFGAVQILRECARAGSWNALTDSRGQWYWYVGTWVVLRLAKFVAHNAALALVAMKLTEPLRVWLDDLLRLYGDLFIRTKSSSELLDYLSKKKFNPVVMCAPKGNGQRHKRFSRPDGDSTDECQRCFCRFGYSCGLPPKFRGRSVPGGKRLHMNIWVERDRHRILGRLESWSAREVGLAVNVDSIPRGAHILFRPRWLSLAQWLVPTAEVKVLSRNSGSLAVAALRWDDRNRPDYVSAAKVIPRHPKLPAPTGAKNGVRRPKGSSIAAS